MLSDKKPHTQKLKTICIVRSSRWVNRFTVDTVAAIICDCHHVNETQIWLAHLHQTSPNFWQPYFFTAYNLWANTTDKYMLNCAVEFYKFSHYESIKHNSISGSSIFFRTHAMVTHLSLSTAPLLNVNAQQKKKLQLHTRFQASTVV
jgi:hypothetical protein